METSRFTYLYQQYLNNQCTRTELEEFFSVLKRDSNKDDIITLMADTWDRTQAIPDTGLTPDFLPLHPERTEHKNSPKAKTWSYQFIAVAASILIIFAGLLFFKSDLTNYINQSSEQQTINTAAQRQQLQLADGTKVWLSPNSKLSYPDKFTGKQRLVNLDGEAFFEVAHDTKHPFIVKTGTVSTTVLGTSFNVNAYLQKQTINITLVTGKVSVALNAKQATLLPNQQVIVNRTTAQITKKDFPEATSFLQKRLGLYEYEGTTLTEVIKDLESQYNIKIELEKELMESNFYGKLNMNDTLTQTLNKLCIVMEIKWKRNGGQYVIGK